MRVAVAFQDERFEFEVSDDRLIAAWEGPPGVDLAALPGLLSEALEHPRDFPPLRQAAVPGDRVALALGADVPEAGLAIEEVSRALQAAGVATDDMVIVAESEASETVLGRLPSGIRIVRHDPEDRSRLAYLASTTEGRRVYLDRELTDADLVVPIGRLGFDRIAGHRGPWGVVFPGLTDAETRQALARSALERRWSGRQGGGVLEESVEVNWLLGCQFQLGLVPGVKGVAGVVAGLVSVVIEQGSAVVDQMWGFEADSRAELVVVGVGLPGAVAGFDELARALDNAARLVRHGGRIVVLSRVAGEIGPSVGRLRDLDDPRAAMSVLKGHEAEYDHAAARQIGAALAWADVYLMSALGPDLVEDLSMVPLESPEEAGRLVRLSDSCLLMSQADVGRAHVAGEDLSPGRGPVGRS